MKKKINKKSLIKKILFGMILNTAVPVFAEDNPLTVINNLSDFIFALTKGIGYIFLIYGTTQIGLSYQSHDPSQRTNGIFVLVGGIIITFSKEILNLIIG